MSPSGLLEPVKEFKQGVTGGPGEAGGEGGTPGDLSGCQETGSCRTGPSTRGCWQAGLEELRGRLNRWKHQRMGFSVPF